MIDKQIGREWQIKQGWNAQVEMLNETLTSKLNQQQKEGEGNSFTICVLKMGNI